MRLFFLLLITIGFSNSLSAQWAMPTQMRASNTLDRLSDADGLSRNDVLYGIPLPPGGVQGDVYLDKKWNLATVLLYESAKMMEGFLVRYDLKEEMLEINAKNGVKVLDVRKIKSLVWIDSLTKLPRYFVNAKDLVLDGVALNGFAEVLTDGQVPLMKRTTVSEKKPDYNVALDMGSRDVKIFKKETLYYLKGNELTKIKNKKSLLNAFGDQADAVSKFIDDNDINISKQSQLQKVFEFYNSKYTPAAN